MGSISHYKASDGQTEIKNIIEKDTLTIVGPAACAEPGCTFVGAYPTSNPEKSAKRPHYCSKHNPRIQHG